jgi:hypothetical protein
MTQLRMLNLSYTPITDAGLAWLKGLVHLQALDVEATKVTNAGIKEFQKVLPKVKVVR